MNQRRESSCPYAVAVSLHEQEDHKDDASTSSSDGEDLVQATMTKCPAFSDSKSCPFKGAKSSEEVRQQLLNMPKSHWQDDTKGNKFYQVVKKLHQVQLDPQQQQQEVASVMEGDTKTSNNSAMDFSLPGGCPVKPVAEKFLDGSGIERQVSFSQAMESLSLAAIMARMAREVGEEYDTGEDSEGSEEFDPLPSVSESAQLPELIPQEETGSSLPRSPKSPPRSPPRRLLAESLKEGTAVSHQAAEDVHFVKNFIRGIIDRELYGRLVIQLYHVYNALEACLDVAGPDYFATCHFPDQLGRKQALLEDLDFWHGHPNVESLPMSDATKDYVDRLHLLADTDPLLLLAHSYTRYLGDLSGGKILARVARKALVLDKDGDGLAFYDFPNISSAKRFKDSFRQAMDALPLTSQQISKLVAEANVAFVLNMRIFEELDVLANIPGAKVRSLSDALESANEGVSSDDVSSTDATTQANNATSKECPFSKLNDMDNDDGKDSKIDSAGSSVAPAMKQGHCPWPFILMHDPLTGLSDWKTWAMIGLLLALCWSAVVQHRA